MAHSHSKLYIKASYNLEEHKPNDYIVFFFFMFEFRGKHILSDTNIDTALPHFVSVGVCLFAVISILCQWQFFLTGNVVSLWLAW